MLKLLKQREAEILEKKAEALNRYNQSALSQMLIEKLPEVVRSAAEPLSKTEKIIMFGDGDAEKMIGDTIRSSLGVVEGLNEGTGIDLTVILNNFTGTKLALDATNKDSETKVFQKEEDTEEILENEKQQETEDTTEREYKHPFSFTKNKEYCTIVL